MSAPAPAPEPAPFALPAGYVAHVLHAAAPPADLADLARLIRELADYERLGDRCHATPDALAAALAGPRPAAEAVVVRHAATGEPVAFAVWFWNFSTFACRPGLYLEDLYVRPAHRGAGLGTALLRGLAARCVAAGGARMEWAVLEWNELAAGRYRAIGATCLDDWRPWRLAGEALRSFAGGDAGGADARG